MQELKLCIRPSEEILSILQNKRNFGSMTDLQNLSMNLFHIKSPFTNRRDLEIDLAIKCMQNKLGPKNLAPFIKTSTPSKPRTARPPSFRKRDSVAKAKPIIQDQVNRWMLMKIKDVEAELNDINKYPDIKSIKSAGNSILTAEDKRKRKRDHLIKLILRHIADEKSILALGT